jgi:hypothetical protein
MKRPFSERVRYYLEHGRMPFEDYTLPGLMLVLHRRLHEDIERALGLR